MGVVGLMVPGKTGPPSLFFRVKGEPLEDYGSGMPCLWFSRIPLAALL